MASATYDMDTSMFETTEPAPLRMTHTTTASDLFGGGMDLSFLSGIFSGGIFLLQIIFFIFYAYFQYKLSKKLDVKYSWMAWVPILTFFNKLFIAGKTIGWWVKWFIVPIVVMILLQIVAAVSQSGAVTGLMLLVNLVVIVILISGYIRMLHGISTRTGHGGWWTVGLLLAGWLFWPVTAVHYEKGDEVTPRPFVGWKKGLLVLSALCVPILFIGGIIGAVMYPMMNSYQSRSLDTLRSSHLRNIDLSLSMYYSDTETYPTPLASGCVSEALLSESYIPNGVPKDPKNIMPGCDGSDGTYAYRTGKNSDGESYFVIGAKMENPNMGNSSLSIDNITPSTPLMRGNGTYYYIVSRGY